MAFRHVVPLLWVTLVLLPHIVGDGIQFAESAVTFTERCSGSNFNSIAQAHAVCQLTSEFLATPRTAAEFVQIGALSPSIGSVLGGYLQSSKSWRWVFGPYTDTIFYIVGIGGVGVSPPWKTGAYLQYTGRVTVYAGGGEWDTAPLYGATNCAVCQSITTCDEVCNSTGTQSSSGTAWSNCTCVCNNGFIGSTCDRRTSIHCGNAAIVASAARADCTARGGYLAAPTTAEFMSDLRTHYLPTTSNYDVLLGGGDSDVEGQWVWTDGPDANKQFWSGLAAGSTVNGYTDYWNSGEPNDSPGEDSLTYFAPSAKLNDINLTFSVVLCYACQYTGCSTSSPCTAGNTLSATGTKFTDCQCGCQPGFGGPYCQCPLNGCDLIGGDVVQGPTNCSCVCKPSYQGVNCTEHTRTRTATALVPTSHTITHVPDVDDTATTCPITMMLYRTSGNTTTQMHSHTIDDTEVREGRLVVNISLNGTAFHAAAPSTITFAVTSTGMQDPGSFAVAVKTSNIVCAFFPVNTTQFIVCTFPQSPDYKLRVAETLVVRGGGTTGLGSSCTDAVWTLGSIRVEPPKQNSMLQAFQVVSTVTAGVATAVVMLLADGTPIEVQIMIVLLNGLCASNVDHEAVVLVRYFISPAIHLGWFWVVVVNVCMAVGFALLHTAIVAAVSALRIRRAKKVVAKNSNEENNEPVTSATAVVDEQSEDIWMQRREVAQEVSAMLLYPGLPLVVCHVLYIGVACGTFDVLRGTDGSRAAISIIGLLYLVIVPLIDAYLLNRVSTAVSYVSYETLGCAPKVGCLSWLYPEGVWRPAADMKRYFGLIGPFRDGYRHAALVPLALALLAALTMHALADVVPCDYLFIIMAIVLCLLGIVVVAVRPNRATVQSLMTALCLVCVGLLAVMQIVATRFNSDNNETAKTALRYLIVIMVIIRSAHNIFVFYIDWKWAKDAPSPTDKDDAAVPDQQQEPTAATGTDKCVPTEKDVDMTVIDIHQNGEGGEGGAPVLPSSHTYPSESSV